MFKYQTSWNRWYQYFKDKLILNINLIYNKPEPIANDQLCPESMRNNAHLCYVFLILKITWNISIEDGFIRSDLLGCNLKFCAVIFFFCIIFAVDVSDVTVYFRTTHKILF